MRMMKSRDVAVGAAFALLTSLGLGACASEPPSTPANDATANVVQSSEETHPEEEAGPSEGELQAYFAALATDDPALMAEAAEMAAPGSNAEAYAIYLAAAAQANRDAGYSPDPSEVTVVKDGFENCPGVASQRDECFLYTNVQHEGDQIADFDAAGDPLSGRLSLGSGEAQPLGDHGQATLVAAYRSIANAVVVVFEVTSASEGMWVTADYVAPDGRQAESSLMAGPLGLSEGAFANYAFFFDGAEFGGQVKLKAIDGDGYDGGTATFATQ